MKLKILHHNSKEICICAAIICDDGYIFRGHRHFHCLQASRMTIQYKNFRPKPEQQGFITSLNRFVGRDEGLKLQLEAGIESAAKQYGDDYRGELFSEDLY